MGGDPSRQELPLQGEGRAGKGREDKSLLGRAGTASLPGKSRSPQPGGASGGAKPDEGQVPAGQAAAAAAGPG